MNHFEGFKLPLFPRSSVPAAGLRTDAHWNLCSQYSRPSATKTPKLSTLAFRIYSLDSEEVCGWPTHPSTSARGSACTLFCKTSRANPADDVSWERQLASGGVVQPAAANGKMITVTVATRIDPGDLHDAVLRRLEEALKVCLHFVRRRSDTLEIDNTRPRMVPKPCLQQYERQSRGRLSRRWRASAGQGTDSPCSAQV